MTRSLLNLLTTLSRLPCVATVALLDRDETKQRGFPIDPPREPTPESKRTLSHR